jgi:uncharacterized protein (DUF1501 family)
MNHHDIDIPGRSTRREFVKRAAVFGSAGVAAPWLLNLAGFGNAAAVSAGSTDYKALVCVFLYGGNDHFNTFVPYDVASYNQYKALRGALARPAESLLPISPSKGFEDGRAVALAPELVNSKSLFDQGNAALVANVGPLRQPLTKAQYADASLRPPQLFSHNDQQSIWQALSPEGATSGWGGRLADLVLGDNGGDSVFTSISVAGNAVFLAGRNAAQFQVASSGVVRPKSPFASPEVLAGLEEVMRLNSPGLFPTSYSSVVQRALSASARLETAVSASAAAAAVFPASALGRQLQMVARLISAGRDQLGLKRQVFFVSMGGFDNHDSLADKHPALLADLDTCLGAFYAATAELGAEQQVTAFTASDFGRTLVVNGNGTDHGWGSHHMVIGGAVRPGRLVGRLPVVAENGPDDVGQGRLLPSTSVDQYAATLAKWFGVDAASIATVLPNLGRFATADLQFMDTGLERIAEPATVLQPAVRLPG